MSFGGMLLSALGGLGSSLVSGLGSSLVSGLANTAVQTLGQVGEKAVRTVGQIGIKKLKALNSSDANINNSIKKTVQEHTRELTKIKQDINDINQRMQTED